MYLLRLIKALERLNKVIQFFFTPIKLFKKR